MNNLLKNLAGMFPVIIPIGLIVLFAISETLKVYKPVKVTFCDSRKPVYTKAKVDDFQEGDISLYIDNHQKGVPTWNGYFNVCQLTIVK
jgi:hypothetical protein